MKKWYWIIGIAVGFPILLVVIAAALLLRPAEVPGIVELDSENLQSAIFTLTGELSSKRNRKKPEITVEFTPEEAAALLQFALRAYQLQAKPGDPQVKWALNGPDLQTRVEVAAPIGVVPVKLTLRPEIRAGKLQLNLRRVHLGALSLPDCCLPELEKAAQEEIPPELPLPFALVRITPDGGLVLTVSRDRAVALLRTLTGR